VCPPGPRETRTVATKNKKNKNDLRRSISRPRARAYVVQGKYRAFRARTFQTTKRDDTLFSRSRFFIRATRIDFMRFISSRRQNASLLLLLSVGNRRVVISDNHSARTALPPNGRPWKLFIYTRPTTDVRNRDDSSPWSHVRVCVHRRPVRVKRSRGYFPV